MRDLDSLKTLRSLVGYTGKLTALGRFTPRLTNETKNPLDAMRIHSGLLDERLALIARRLH